MPGRPRKENSLTAAERMRAYRARKRAAGLKHVSEWRQVEPADSVIWSDHRLLDARSLALHCKIAQKISREPDLLKIPRRNLKRWKKRASGQTPNYLNEWEAILTQPWPAVATFITSLSEKATRLRQSSPFAGVLEPQERKQVYDAFRT
ncbi:MAG: hypothetical protein ACE5GZ_10185 [Gammaproteobacteria bacterium]